MACFSISLHHLLSVLILAFIPSVLVSAQNPIRNSESDFLALLDFKNRITDDPLGIMASWNDSVDHCSWTGITCNPLNRRVTILDLRSKKLVGSLSPSLTNLTLLTGLNLIENRFHGDILQEICLLSSLKQLNLTNNMFSGNIPSNLRNCTQLTFLALEYNQLEGQIPETLSSMTRLQYLGLGGNKLTGTLPASIGNMSSSFWGVSLALNSLHGTIPSEIGRLSGLRFFQVYGNRFSGTIPSSIYNISSMNYFSVTQNQFHGELPSDIGFRFPNLEIFAGGVNNFTGVIPVSLSNASGLVLVDFAQNRLSGTVPSVLGSLPGLYRINFDGNNLGNGSTNDLDFMDSLTNCTNLEVLGLSINFFGGELPSSISNLSTRLRILTLGGNLIRGNLPFGIGNLVNLSLLGLEGNYFTGRIPDDFRNLGNLGELYLTGNGISGKIPSSLGNLTSLIILHLQYNMFIGSIPSEIGNCTSLNELILSDNNLTGTIPKEIMSLSSLSVFLDMARNSLSGPLPVEVSRLINLKELDLSENRLSGKIPNGLGMCLSLENLIMGGNNFQGSVPNSLEGLRGLVQVNFSHNNLSGKLPYFFSKLPFLEKLDLSFNNFEGQVPNEGIFSNKSGILVEGNVNLCGGSPILRLRPCSNPSKNSSNRNLSLRTIVLVAVSAVLFIIVLCSFAVYYFVKRPKDSRGVSSSRKDSSNWSVDKFPRKDCQLSLSYQEIYNATNGFHPENLIGSGSFGSVYRGILKENETMVAVKVLNLEQKGARKSFLDECETLKSVKHRNLLKIITACSSVDNQGNEFKCLIFEFMKNGSLDQWLHPRTTNPRKSLSIMERLNIVIDVGLAIDYLHNYCTPPIIHCDLKPSNILLDEDLTGHVGDFGLAKFLLEESETHSKKQAVSFQLKGSIGYIPPEYGTSSEISTVGDVYSYGIMILEVFTGKRPTDDMFKDGLNIHNYAAMALPENVLEVSDSSLLLEEKQDIRNDQIRRADEAEEIAILPMRDCLASVLQIGVSCSMPLPKNRMPINVALNRFHEIRDLIRVTKNK